MANSSRQCSVYEYVTEQQSEGLKIHVLYSFLKATHKKLTVSGVITVLMFSIFKDLLDTKHLFFRALELDSIFCILYF